MEALSSGKSRIACEASSSGFVHDGRDPQAPPLARVVTGGHLKLLDLAWASGRHYDTSDESRRPVWPLIQGMPIAPPPLAPEDKGKGPLLPLSGVAHFAVQYIGGNVYTLVIQRPGARSDRYYCNIAQPKDRHSWCASYRTYAEAADCDRMASQEDDLEARFALARARTASWHTLQTALPTPVGPRADPLASLPVPLALPPLPKLPTQRFDFTPEEAQRRLKALGRALPPHSELVWGAYEGAHLLAVALAPRANRAWPWRDKSPGRACQLYHAPLHQPWSAPHRAQVLGGGVFPPTEPGQSTTVRTDEACAAPKAWLMELDIDEGGVKVATINDREAVVVEGAVMRGG